MLLCCVYVLCFSEELFVSLVKEGVGTWETHWVIRQKVRERKKHGGLWIETLLF